MSAALPTAALGVLESLINRALALDSNTQERLNTLTGHSFKLDCTQPAVCVVLIVGDSQLLLQNGSETPATTTLSGSWDEFAKIAIADDPASALINGNVRVDGDTTRVLELRTILSELDIDWEAPLAKLLGDVAAHQLGKTIRQGNQWAKKAFTAFRRQASEFVREESQWAPHPIEVEDFYRDVEALALHTDKLQARLKKLQQRLKPSPELGN
ncbi:MAG: ubiquinone biosynthesis protein UbiJ [Bacteroidia bacterium]|jgi:ubiquinone biosynthesis protein UbiJ